MCFGCYVEQGSPAIISERTQTAAALIAKVYEFNEVGGALHIVVDDWNLDDSSLKWCAGHIPTSDGSDDQKAAETACLEALAALSVEERASALAIHDGFLKVEKDYSVA